MIIDANNMIVGRIGTFAAKQALLGEKIDIVNCENAIITGKKKFLYNEFKRKKDMGTFKGPFFYRTPERFVKRMIRGMLPYKQEKGRKAFERIKCYKGIPAEFNGKEIVRVEKADMSKLKNLDYLSVRDICKRLGSKVN